MDTGAYGCDVLNQPVIERMNVPVCISEGAASLVELVCNIVWQLCSRVGQAKQEGAVATADLKEAHVAWPAKIRVWSGLIPMP